jgi:hypothetical protein
VGYTTVPRSGLLLLFARSIAIALVGVVVIVPTVTRSRRHITLRESTRLGIRMNWQSDAPPERPIVAPDDLSTRTSATVAAVQPLRDLRFPPARKTVAEPIVQSPFDDVLDLFRRPPPSRI